MDNYDGNDRHERIEFLNRRIEKNARLARRSFRRGILFFGISLLCFGYVAWSVLF